LGPIKISATVPISRISDQPKSSNIATGFAVQHDPHIGARYSTAMMSERPRPGNVASAAWIRAPTAPSAGITGQKTM
jgi:hypothetical protein